MNRRRIVLSAGAVALGGPAFGAVKAPRVGALAGPAPLPYDETADAEGELAAAMIRAKSRGRRLLISFGGNWCPDCRVLGAVLAAPEAKPFVQRHFETVHVDVGRKDKNLHLAARYGLSTLKGVPAVVVVGPDGRVLNRGGEFALTTARSWSPQAVVDQLAAWAG